MRVVSPECLVALFLEGRKRGVTLTTLMRSLAGIHRSLLEHALSAQVGFRTGATGQLWSEDVCAALRRMVHARLLHEGRRGSEPTYRLCSAWDQEAASLCGISADSDVDVRLIRTTVIGTRVSSRRSRWLTP